MNFSLTQKISKIIFSFSLLIISGFTGYSLIKSVTKVNAATPCIVTLFGVQYDVSPLQPTGSHPGGNIFVCGTDMTAVYQGIHGTNVSRMAPYLLSTPTPTATATPTATTTPVPPSPTVTPTISPTITPTITQTPSPSPSVKPHHEDEHEDEHEDVNENETENHEHDRNREYESHHHQEKTRHETSRQNRHRD